MNIFYVKVVKKSILKKIIILVIIKWKKIQKKPPICPTQKCNNSKTKSAVATNNP